MDASGTDHDVRADAPPLTRRAARGRPVVPAAPTRTSVTASRAPTSVPASRPPRRTAPRIALSALVMAIAGGLVATLALPSYAFDPTGPDVVRAAGRSTAEDGEQRFTASGGLEAAELQRDTFSATSSATLRRRAFAQQFSSYTGPTADDYLKNPAHPPFSLDAVYATALQYRGVPYVFGGADPSGFDCSGYVMFVYAQYGVGLPHSVHGQDAVGTPIAPEDAQVGDVVIFNDGSHDGFYAGEGMILHAPYPGASVRVQPLWHSNVHFVRFGI